MPFQRISSGMHTKKKREMREEGTGPKEGEVCIRRWVGGREITFYKGYADFPTFDLFRETSSQWRYPSLVYSYYLVDKPMCL